MRYLYVVLFLVFSLGSLNAQHPPPLDGPGVVLAGTAYEYSFTGLVISPSWNFPSGTATINSTWAVGNTYYASVTWTTSGSIKFFDEALGGPNVTKSVTVFGIPAVTNASRCGTGTVMLSATLSTGATGLRWYSEASGGTLLSSATSYTTPSLTAGTYTYWVENFNSTYSLSSARVAVTVTVGAIPSVTSVISAERCGSGTVTLQAAPGSPSETIAWYSASTGGDPVHTGTSFTTPVLSNTKTYYAASYTTTPECASPSRTPVTATIKAMPGGTEFESWPAYGSAQITVEARSRFTKWTGVQFIYVPDTSLYHVRWFSNETNANANTPVINTGLTYVTPLINTTTTYYVRLQDKVNGCLGPLSPAVATILPYIMKQNVTTEVIRVPGMKTEAHVLALHDSLKSKTVIHFDGLGRATQQIAVKASPESLDIIQPVEYDEYGRVTKQYLPYSDTVTGNLGTYRSGYLLDQLNFYQAAPKVAHDNNPYSKSTYEPSPLGGILEQTNAGQAFQPGSGHTGTIVYGFNTGATASEAEEVRKFNPDGSSPGFYAANILSRTEGINADGIRTITYTDPAGRTVVTKQQLDETINGTPVTYLETYYIYDDFGQLKFTIQPEGVAALKAGSWNFNAANFKEQHVFQYVYDARGRVIETKVPGKGWSYTVYNQLNQPVLVQDALTRNTNQWLFMKYDRAGRAVMTGLYTDNTNTTRTYFQTLLNNKNYDTERYVEKRASSGTHQYSNDAFPTANTEVLSVTYYDTYDFDTYGTYTAQSISGEGTQGQSIGKVTGSKTLIPGTATWLKNYVYYDGDGRVIQVRSNNQLNTTPDNLSTTVYDFEKVLQTKTYHNAGTPGNTTVVNKFDYYRQGRLKHVKQQNNAGAEQLVVKYEYNALGQVVDKKLHRKSDGNFLQSVDYRYTINGQLASINNATLDASGTANDDTNDYFGMELLYNTAESGLTTAQRYDGMVSALKWKSPGAGSGSTGQKSYAYAYDKSGKLETAAYAVKGASTWNQETGAQDEAMSYDRNGNIKSLTRKQRKHQLAGITASYTSETIDNLTYAYKTADKNSLEKITDAAGAAASAGFNNGTSSTNNDYAYDINGNLLSDKNKGIDSIKYNFLGKPVRMKFSDGKVIAYVYDAGGNKLTQKLYNGAALQTTTHYVNGFVYEAVTTGSPALSFFGSPEGRIVKNGSNLEYEYSIADHQGNTRVVFSGAAQSAHTTTVNFESASDTVMNYTRTNFELMDHTDFSGSTYTYSQKLTGGVNSQVGVAKTLKVYPGDKVKIDAYAKYYNPTSTSSNITGFALALTGAFGVTSGSTGEALKAYNTLNSYGGIIAAGGSGGSSSHPKLFVNILLFDKDYNFLDAAWEQIDGGEQVGATPKTAHDLMSKEVTVKEAGYAYVFISNESPTLVEFYVDDVTITHTPTNVIQYNEYYPFGLSSNTSWTRENTKDNNYLYNSANELNKTSGWYEMFYRGYDPAIGRMLQVDPYAPMYASSTTYNYALNNPVMMNDPNGGQADIVDRALRSLNRTSSYMASVYSNYGSEWANSTSSYFFEPIYYNAEDYTRGGSIFTQTSAERAAAQAAESYPGSDSFWYEVDGAWYGVIVNYDANGEVQIISAGATEGNGGALIGGTATIYDQETQGGERSDPNSLDRFFDIAGRADVVASSILTSFSKGFETTSEQIARSKYWTQATKSTTSTFAKNLKFAGYAGIVASTFISGYELYLNGGTWGGWARFGVGLGITATGFIPYAGVPIAIGLGTYEAGGGLDGFYKDMDSYQSIHRLFTGGK